MTDTIIVVGRRPIEPISDFDVAPFLFLPTSFMTVDWITGEGGLPQPFSVNVLEQNGRRVFQFEGIDTVVAVTDEDWNQMTPRERDALTYILSNLSSSGTLMSAFQHYHDQGIREVRISKDSMHIRPNGERQPFPPGDAAQTSHLFEGTDRNNLAPGTNIYITINSEMTLDLHTTSVMIVHELIHPWVLDVTWPDDVLSDEDRPEYPGFYPRNISVITQEILDEMMPTGSSHPGHSIENATGQAVGASFMGSFGGDQFTGTGSE